MKFKVGDRVVVKTVNPNLTQYNGLVGIIDRIYSEIHEWYIIDSDDAHFYAKTDLEFSVAYKNEQKLKKSACT